MNTNRLKYILVLLVIFLFLLGGYLYVWGASGS